jgi:hypothetical protein
VNTPSAIRRIWATLAVRVAGERPCAPLLVCGIAHHRGSGAARDPPAGPAGSSSNSVAIPRNEKKPGVGEGRDGHAGAEPGSSERCSSSAAAAPTSRHGERITIIIPRN